MTSPAGGDISMCIGSTPLVFVCFAGPKLTLFKTAGRDGDGLLTSLVWELAVWTVATFVREQHDEGSRVAECRRSSL
jgi:hypothetical protein